MANGKWQMHSEWRPAMGACAPPLFAIWYLPFAILLLWVTTLVVPAGVATAAPSDAIPKDLTPEAMQAIEKGLTWLAKAQGADGSYTYQGAGTQGGNPGITGLAGIAFMAGGSYPGRGPYADNVERAAKYVISKTHPRTGFISNGGSRMYEHGFAALFLAEVYGMTRRDDVRPPLIRSINLIENCQSPQGGWRYNPTPDDADISVTICQIMALRAARNSGIRVSKRVIDNGVKYVKACQNKDGGFSYQPSGGGFGGSGYARTAAGVCSLYYAGVYGDPDIQRGIDWMVKNPDQGNMMSGGSHYYYGHYYAVQAMYQAGGKVWSGYFPRMRDQLVKTQQADGSWSLQTGGTFETEVALILLQVPYGYLPILQR